MDPRNFDKIKPIIDKWTFLRKTLTNTETGEVAESESIFDGFFKYHLVNHIKKVTEGIQNKETMRLAIAKYCASLLMLTNFKIKEIAASLKLKYGVIRVWRTQENFKEQIKCNREDFAKYFRDKLYSLQGKDVHEFLDTLAAEEKHYDGDVIRAIAEVLVNAMKGGEGVADPDSILFWDLNQQFGIKNTKLVGQLYGLLSMKWALKRRDNKMAMEWLKVVAQSIAKGIPEDLKDFRDALLKKLS